MQESTSLPEPHISCGKQERLEARAMIVLGIVALVLAVGAPLLVLVAGEYFETDVGFVTFVSAMALSVACISFYLARMYWRAPLAILPRGMLFADGRVRRWDEIVAAGNFLRFRFRDGPRIWLRESYIHWTGPEKRSVLSFMAENPNLHLTIRSQFLVWRHKQRILSCHLPLWVWVATVVLPVVGVGGILVGIYGYPYEWLSILSVVALFMPVLLGGVYVIGLELGAEVLLWRRGIQRKYRA